MAAIVVGTNSYVTVAELETYALDRGKTITGDTSVLLISAMDYIEAQPYSGCKTDPDQALQFPRYPATKANPDTTVVPDSIKNAEMVAALLIDSGVDLYTTVGRAVKKEKVDVIETEFMDNAAESARYPQLDSLLAPFYSSSAGGFEVKRG